MTADIIVKSLTAPEVQEIIERLIAEGKMHNGGVGKYKTFSHYDVRENSSRW